jgi:hypothetical protein
MKSPLGVLCVTGVISGLVILTILFLPVRISGRVLSSTTGLPISGALVSVESGNEFEGSGTGDYVITDQSGNFTARAQGSWISVNAWKQGYAMNGALYGYALGRIGHENVIHLRELTPTNRLDEHDKFYALQPGTGFSFSAGKPVKGDSFEADFVITQDPNKRSIAFMEAQGEGGIQSQLINETIDFYNSPVAPAEGYQRRIEVPSYEATLYFLRTRDGRHYAKFRFMTSVAWPPQGAEYLDLENVRLIWAYQPDGTRNLEINPSKKMPFPFHKFDLNRDSISQ